MPTTAGTRARGALLAACAFALGVAGCSLLVSTSGLAGEVGSGDGGPLPGEASTTDVGLPEAGTDADADLPPFCAALSPPPKLCADFDTGSLADFGEPNGTVTLDTALSTSAPRSLSCEVPTGSAKRGALVSRSFGDTPASYDLSFDVYVDAYDATLDVELITMRLAMPGDVSCGTNVSIRNSVWTVDESCEANGSQTYGISHRSMLGMKLGRWTHIDTSVSFTARTFSLTVDGQPLFSAAPVSAALKAGPLTLLLGIVYTQTAATTAKVHLDNVRFDYR